MSLRALMDWLFRRTPAPTPAPAPRPLPTPSPAPSPAPAPTPFPTPGPAPAPEPAHPELTVAALVAAHNAARKRAGLAPLNAEARLQASAQEHADYMARVRKMAHQGIGDGTPFERMEAHGYRFGYAGENAAEGQADVEAVMRAWMGSPGHKANILGRSFTDMGSAVGLDRDGVPYWCTTMAAPLQPHQVGLVGVGSAHPATRLVTWATPEGGRLCLPASNVFPAETPVGAGPVNCPHCRRSFFDNTALSGVCCPYCGTLCLRGTFGDAGPGGGTE